MDSFSVQSNFTADDWRATLWSEPDPDNSADSYERAEDLLISQGPRIDAAIQRVAAPEAGHPGIYFVGFAGVGRQKVFAEESNWPPGESRTATIQERARCCS